MEQDSILVVDDDVKNIRLIRLMLNRERYRVSSACSGSEALEVIKKNEPDLILLDIMMPGLDGFETCKQLKADEITSHIPVIMVTALQEKEDRLRAMEAGGDDFITKPIDQTELLIRVKSLLRIKRYHDRLRESNEELAEKNVKLEELEAHKEYLTHMIVHDMRNPLNAITMGTEILLRMDCCGHEELQRVLHTCRSSCVDLEQMIQNILDIRKLEENGLELNRKVVDLSGIIHDVVEQFRVKLDTANLRLTVSEQSGTPNPRADRELIKRIIANLLNNAIRHTPKEGEIRIDVRGSEEALVLFSMADSGAGIPEELQEGIFDTFTQVKSVSTQSRFGSYGLGLAFCRMALEAHGGRIWVESKGAGRGSTFTFVLPV
jgi:signal transduction histidine kinase